MWDRSQRRDLMFQTVDNYKNMNSQTMHVLYVGALPMYIFLKSVFITQRLSPRKPMCLLLSPLMFITLHTCVRFPSLIHLGKDPSLCCQLLYCIPSPPCLHVATRPTLNPITTPRICLTTLRAALNSTRIIPRALCSSNNSATHDLDVSCFAL